MIDAVCRNLGNAALLTCLVFSNTAYAQIGAAVERAAARAALKAAKSQTAKRTTAGAVATASRGSISRPPDRVVRKWSSSLCKPSASCPLDEKTANTFVGGSYKEVILGRDTVLHRVYQDPTRKFGDPNGQVSYWSRSDAKGIKAVVDRGIEVSRYGNTVGRTVAIKVPEGTRVYEGTAQGVHKGPVGGGNQIVLDKVRSDWEVKKH